jgi:uncharacterized membrane-anchored protein
VSCTLEAQLSLQQTIEGLAVLASVGAVQTVIRAHDIGSTGEDSILEGPQVELVNRFVVNVGRD